MCPPCGGLCVAGRPTGGVDVGRGELVPKIALVDTAARRAAIAADTSTSVNTLAPTTVQPARPIGRCRSVCGRGGSGRGACVWCPTSWPFLELTVELAAATPSARTAVSDVGSDTVNVSVSRGTFPPARCSAVLCCELGWKVGLLGVSFRSARRASSSSSCLPSPGTLT